MSTEKKAVIKNSIFAAVFFAVFFGIFEAIIFGIGYAAISAPIAGIFFGLLMYFFVNSKRVKAQTALNNSNESDIIHSGGANHFKNAEALGGKLYLLPDRLEFKSHRFNIQNHAFSIGINEIKKIAFYKTLGIVPNGLEVVLKDGEVEKFVVNNRNLWKENIEKLISKSL
ncbi:hypothetical protein EZ449_07100 [Pedobacter frigidisoli]|uniref:GRAM domain-containing protein n=1 Tax=Pedobacter frigidisoli TaxID=2530455 RepID=A0A4R0P3P1_9SPHI|nr:hypothetical protein [Pedobacter frigidisoli]TCD11249.1 hypothetical protein EZ449_07100 [Pedobacter frigidisoli]